MPINPSIPLGVQPIQVNNPVQDWGQAINVADLIQRRQANQMLMQERMIDMQAKQRALDAQNTMGQLIAQHTIVAPDGAVSVDHDAVKLGLAQKGYTPELFKYDNDLRANLKAQRDAQEAQNKVHAQQAERLGNLAIGILQAPKEVRPEAYKAALRQAAHEGLIPVTAAEQAIAQGYTPDTESQVQQWVNSSPAIKSYIDVQREAREQQTASLLGEQHKATTAKLNAEIPEAKAKAEQAQMNTFGQRAQAAQTQADWDKLRADYPQFNVPALFSPQAARQVAQKYGETPTQLATREQAAANAANTERHQKVLEQQGAARVAQGAQRVQIAQGRENRETAATHKQTISKLADQAIAESAQGGGGSLDDAIANVQNQTYYQNHPIGDNRGEVLSELRRRQNQNLTVGKKEQDFQKGDQISGLERLQWMKDHPGQPVPSRSQMKQQGGGGGTPGTTTKTAPPPATKSPAAPVRVRYFKGKPIVVTKEYPDGTADFRDATPEEIAASRR